ncbi:MAG: LysE family transporter, partial [Candidatus Brocadiia bacterium]
MAYSIGHAGGAETVGLAQLFVASFVTALSGVLMPGPVLFMTVRHSASEGCKVGPLIIAGHAVVEIPLMVAVVVGLRGLLARDVFVGVVGTAGGALLLVMSAMMLRSLPRLHLPGGAGAPAVDSPGVLGLVAAGALTSVANPYFTLWWATVGMKFLAEAAAFTLLGYAVFYAGHISADLAWYGAVSESVHRGRRLLS